MTRLSTAKNTYDTSARVTLFRMCEVAHSGCQLDACSVDGRKEHVERHHADWFVWRTRDSGEPIQ